MAATDLAATPAQVIERYAARRSIGWRSEDAKQNRAAADRDYPGAARRADVG